MSRKVMCPKMGEELDGLDYPPFPGPLGLEIFETVSKEGWKLWLGQQTILINEYRLSSLDKKAQSFLKEEMKKFLFSGEEIELPKEFTAK